MAFVSINNPDGIQHHGGQMDWCRISATRVAMLTYTKDNKALLQEINYVNGATVIGTPTFLKQVPDGGPTYRHLRSFVRVLSADRLFVMVPTAFTNMQTGTANADACAFLGHASYAALITACGTPSAWTCMTLQRNGDGTYTVDSTADIDMTVIGTSAYRPARGFPVDIFIEDAQILIRSLTKVTSTNRYERRATLTLVDGKITSKSTNTPLAVNTTSPAITSVRERLTPDGDVVRIYTGMSAIAASSQDVWAATNNNAASRLLRNPYVLASSDSPWPDSGVSTGMYINPAAWLPISKTDSLNSLHVGGTAYFNNGTLPNWLNGNQADGGTEVLNPLDSAWVAKDTACVVGYAAKYDGTNAGTTPVYFPGDMAYTVNPDYYDTAKGGFGTVVRKLSMSFRTASGAGVYAGPFDPADTGVYFKYGMNVGNMIHRISDSAFWLIGCFMDSPTADPKLGVITVKA